MAGGNLGWLDDDFQLDDAFQISDPLFSNGSFLGYFPATEGFFDSGSWLAFVGGSEMSVLVAVEWPKMICVGRTEVRKLATCKFSSASVWDFSLLFWPG